MFSQSRARIGRSWLRRATLDRRVRQVRPDRQAQLEARIEDLESQIEDLTRRLDEIGTARGE